MLRVYVAKKILISQIRTLNLENENYLLCAIGIAIRIAIYTLKGMKFYANKITLLFSGVYRATSASQTLHRSMKLRILNIADVKGELAQYCISNITSHYARVQISSDLLGTGIKLLVEKESIEYTLPRDAASRLGYIKILFGMKGRAKDEERRSILPSPPKISQARISTFVHLCASRRPQSTCYIPSSMGEKRRKQLSLPKNF